MTMMMEECKDELDVDVLIQILRKINSLLPESLQVRIPSLIINDFISVALYNIEERLLLAA